MANDSIQKSQEGEPFAGAFVNEKSGGVRYPYGKDEAVQTDPVVVRAWNQKEFKRQLKDWAQGASGLPIDPIKSYNEKPYIRLNESFLSVGAMGVTEFPPMEILAPGEFKKIDVSWNQIKAIPEEIRDLRGYLKELEFDHNHVTTLPNGLWDLSCLEQLSFSDNNVSVLPEDIGKLGALSSLSAADNQLSILPKGLWDLGLTFLDLNNNQLTEIPPEIGKLHNLKYLFLSKNPLETFPWKEIEQLRSLVTITLPLSAIVKEGISDPIRKRCNIEQHVLNEIWLNF